MIDLWRVLRMHNLLIAMVGVLAGGWIALGEIALPKLLVFAAVSALGLGAVGNVANDLWDVAGDRINRSAGERPVAGGRITRERAHLLAWLGLLLGLAAAALVSGTQVAVGLSALLVMFVYSPWLKRHGWPGNLAVATVAGLPLFYGALSVGRPGGGIIPWVLAACLHLAREVVKDVQDQAGDRKLGRSTIPVRWGEKVAVSVAGWACVAFIPLSVALPLAARYGRLYFLVAAVAQGLIVLAVFRLRRRQLREASRLLKTAMVIGLGALVLGRVT